MAKLVHLTASQMLLYSMMLGRKLYEAGVRPKHAVSIWRGGTAVGLGVDAFYRSRGLLINHTTIATESYVGVGKQEEVVVKQLEHIIETVCPEDPLLLIDDVYETGMTVKKVIEILRKRARANTPEEITVGTVHVKPDRIKYKGVRVVGLFEVEGDVWIDYPHELADLITDDPDDPLIKEKNPKVWELLQHDYFEPEEEHIEGGYKYVQPEELLLDAVKLGVNIFADRSFRPNFLVALWPGGISAGLPVHEVYKYKLKKSGEKVRPPDHISLNTIPSHLTYKTNVIGLHYLAERINRDDNVLIIDSTFKGGKHINQAVLKLKEVLRRNLDLDRVRVAAVYWNPEDRSTWTVTPEYTRPHYYVKKVDGKIIYPHAVHRLRNPREELKVLNPSLYSVLYE